MNTRGNQLARVLPGPRDGSYALVPMLALVALAVLAGCAGRPSAGRIDVGSYAFVGGEFVGQIERPIAAVRKDAEVAMLARGIVSPSSRGSGDLARLEGDDARGRRVIVRLRALGSATRVTISIGTIGDESDSATLFKAISEASAVP